MSLLMGDVNGSMYVSRSVCANYELVGRGTMIYKLSSTSDIPVCRCVHWANHSKCFIFIICPLWNPIPLVIGCVHHERILLSGSVSKNRVMFMSLSGVFAIVWK